MIAIYPGKTITLFKHSFFQILCGTEPFPEKFKAKKYKLHDHYITKKSFFQMMTNLPEKVFLVDNSNFDNPQNFSMVKQKKLFLGIVEDGLFKSQETILL